MFVNGVFFIGLPENTAAHKGMSMGAAKMLRRLMPVLDRAFQQFPHYDLILTGERCTHKFDHFIYLFI